MRPERGDGGEGSVAEVWTIQPGVQAAGAGEGAGRQEAGAPGSSCRDPVLGGPGREDRPTGRQAAAGELGGKPRQCFVLEPREREFVSKEGAVAASGSAETELGREQG